MRFRVACFLVIGFNGVGGCGMRGRIINACCTNNHLGNARLHRLRHSAELHPTKCDRERAGRVCLFSGRWDGANGRNANAFSDVYAD